MDLTQLPFNSTSLIVFYSLIGGFTLTFLIAKSISLALESFKKAINEY